MQNVKSPFKDRLFVTGIGFIALSLFFFCLPHLLQLPNDSNFMWFIASFALAGLYLIMLLVVRDKERNGLPKIYKVFLFLILFFISAWSLNRDLVVFEESVPWFTVLQVVVCINYITLAFFERFPRWLQHVTMCVLGVAFMLFFYLSAYLLPYYPLSAAAFFVLGISLHTFVPLLFIIYTCFLVHRFVSLNRRYWYSLAIGSGSTLLIALFFVFQWALTVNNINKTWRNAGVTEGHGLPTWVRVSQKVPHGWITEKALKAGLVYSIPDNFSGASFWRVPGTNFGEVKKHDPLVMTAALFSGVPNIGGADRIKVLEAMYNARHEAQERLWSGDDLFTENVYTNVAIWPQYGLSYTEKIITVTNQAPGTGWSNRQQEAIYTFYLPEGAVVTALSLWIEGIEAKGILTTKEKAATAYNTIVGREVRDPSVVHWQEGNTVSVRVFPVLAGESRKFRLGITAPLNHTSGSSVYENIRFKGPAANRAGEVVEIRFKDKEKHYIVPASFTLKEAHTYTVSRRYKPDWQLKVSDRPLSANAFCFDGKAYSLRPYEAHHVPAYMQKVYLDVNSSWSRTEFDEMYELLKGKEVFVYHEKIVPLTNANKNELFEALRRQQFSLFPVFLISDIQNSLLITKCPAFSPNISDLQGSVFSEQLKQCLGRRKEKIRLYNTGHNLSPFLKSLKEYRVFQYEQGDIRNLRQLLRDNVFAADDEQEGQIVIHHAGIMIRKTDCNSASLAPDHLMRLFAYNSIMQKMGTRLLTDTIVQKELIDEAAKAYVVSPVSSLVVLEKQEDYERFGISDSNLSLKNASMQSKGAVPEPHEWALIIIAAGIIVYVRFFHNKKSIV